MTKSLVFLFMLVLTMLFVVGCNDNPTEEPVTPTITLSGPTEVEVGSEISLTATVTGIEQYVLTWKSSDATVATVDNEGNVLGVKAGTVTIEASIAEVKGTYSVTVKEKPVNPNERVVFFNHDWEESDWDGEQAFADGEGNNFMIQGGKAHTINNSGKIGPCSSWSFAYTPYDMNIGECVVEAKVKYVGSSVENECAAFSIRHLYALFYDLQIFFENGDTYSGIRLYNSVSSYVGDSRDVNMGGQATDTRFVAGQDYVIKLAYEYVTDTTANVYVYVNDVLELFLEELPTQDVNAKFGIGASVYSHIEVDYFKCYSPLDSDYTSMQDLKVLFVGNSFTYYNESWNIFANIAASEGYRVTVDSVTSGGYTLEQMNNPQDKVGSILHKKLETNQYDIVVLQEHSTRPISQPSLFFDSVRDLKIKIDQNGAKIILCERIGSESNTSYSMFQKLIASHNAIAEELGIDVSHVGTALYDIYTNNSQIDIYGVDRAHPSKLGSYVIALTHYATIYGKSPIGINYKYFEDEVNQRIIEQAVHDAVFGESILDAEYRVSSEGVTAK